VTILSAHRTAPKITKQYRLWRRYDEGSADYYCIDADGTELLSLRPGKPPFRHIIGRFFQDCAYCPECTWPECPNRFPKPGTGWVQGQWRGHDGSVPPKMWVDGRAVPTEWVDHLGRYVPQDVESSEPTATGEDATHCRTGQRHCGQTSRILTPRHSAGQTLPSGQVKTAYEAQSVGCAYLREAHGWLTATTTGPPVRRDQVRPPSQSVVGRRVGHRAKQGVAVVFWDARDDHPVLEQAHCVKAALNVERRHGPPAGMSC
jgi:hypothetical protein